MKTELGQIALMGLAGLGFAKWQQTSITKTPVAFAAVTIVRLALEHFNKDKQLEKDSGLQRKTKPNTKELNSTATCEKMSEKEEKVTEESKFEKIKYKIFSMIKDDRNALWGFSLLTALAVKTLGDVPAMNALALLGTTLYTYTSTNLISCGCKTVFNEIERINS